jgi:zinc protease
MKAVVAALAGLCAAWLAAAEGALAQTGAEKPAWAHLASDIAPDPAVTYGVLPNGMRYALLPNRLPADAISMRLAFDFGSLHEAEDEQGLAHFIEHMAFNGSRNVPEGEMVRILERHGLAFGADTNAQTSQTHTTYMLDLPHGDAATVDDSLMLLRETASELLFEPEAIERERGVVMAEYRRGDTFARRRMNQQLDFLIPGSRAAARLPIGKPDVIETAPRARFVSLYERYYRPERAVLVVVGDFDLAAMQAKITARFSDWAGRGEAGAEPDLAYTPSRKGPAASVFVHKDGGDSLGVYSLSPYEELPDTAAYRKESNLLSFATGAVSRRMARLANSEAPPFRTAGVALSDVLEAADASTGSVQVTPGAWKAGLRALEQEWRRALQYGFTKDEIDQQVAALRTSVANSAQREGTRTTGQLVDQLTGAILDDAVFATPSSGLARFEGWAEDATPERVLEVMRRRLPMTSPLIFLGSTQDLPKGIEDAITAAWEESAGTPVAAPAARATGRFAYTDFGSPGRVTKDARMEDIGARALTFANNVRLTIRKTDFQKNVVMASVRVGGGDLDFPEKPFGLDAIMGAYSGGGLKAHSADDLRNILSGRAVQTGFRSSSTAFGGTYTTTPADFELQMQVAAAFLTAPGYRPEAERRWRESVVLSWPRLDANAQSVLGAKGLRMLAGGDKRFGYDPDDGEVYRSFTELAAYLAPSLKTGAIEIAVAGDIDEAQVIAAVARTFGALPTREAASTKWTSDRPAAFRTERTPITLHHGGETNQAIANVYWPVPVDPDAEPQAARVLNVLAAVMRLKVTEEVRERLGASYSPSAGVGLSPVTPGFGYLTAGAEVKPEDADAVIAALERIAADIRAGEVSEDEFQRAVTPMLDQLPRNATSNAYWLSLIAQAQSRPELTERAKLDVVEASIRAVTIADVVAAAERWLRPEAAQEMRVLPRAE